VNICDLLKTKFKRKNEYMKNLSSENDAANGVNTVYLAILNITSWVGQCGDAEHKRS
jgi:serine/threonine protein phosphatase PrpC